MDKIILLYKFDVSSVGPQVNKHWRLWYSDFTYYFLHYCSVKSRQSQVLYLNMSAIVADIIDGCSGFKHAIELQTAVYDKSPNVIHARHLLSNHL